MKTYRHGWDQGFKSSQAHSVIINGPIVSASDSHVQAEHTCENRAITPLSGLGPKTLMRPHILGPLWARKGPLNERSDEPLWRRKTAHTTEQSLHMAQDK